MTWYEMKIKDVLSKLDTHEKKGLTTEEAELRTSRYGKNELLKQKKTSLIKRFFIQLNDYMVIILLAAAVVSYVVSLMGGSGDLSEPAIILAIVILNAVIGVVQENKAEKAIEALSMLTASVTTVIRDGKTIKINAEHVTVGDIIILKAGDRVPADARIIEENMFKTDESALTGEFLPVEKTSRELADKNITVSDMKNMIWSSTLAVSGTCKAVAVCTGMDTQVGKIANMISTGETPQTPLQNKLAAASKVMGIGAIVICIFIFIIGVLNKIEIFEMFMTAVSLAVAAIPEGLPAIVTVMLALGVRKMAQKNAVVRKLPAVETLGCANVICSDKTGTLTKNKMTVERIIGDRNSVITLALMCNNNSDPTEQAVVNAGEIDMIKFTVVQNMHKKIQEKPFNSNDKFMVTLHNYNGKYRQVIKGAPDVLLKKCSVMQGDLYKINKYIDDMAQEALRVLAVGYVDMDSPYINNNAVYKFAGLIGISDPLRAEVYEAVRTCKEAGIKPVMITGDHKATALAIAKKAGISNGNDIITGEEINKLSDEEFNNKVKDLSVFARVTPEHKVRIVNAFQNNGMVTAMTGDGVNDAPALQRADIGCAMGTGTDVAKGASDIVLVDDNFATIIEAVKQGRVIYSNIRKTVHFLLSSNIGEILTIFIAIILGMPAPLTAIQLLWVNLITDSLPAIALGMENNEEEIMHEKPVDRKKSIFADGMAFNFLLEGTMISTLSLIAYFIGHKIFCDLTVARTMAFCVLSLSQLVHSFNMHSERPIVVSGLDNNKFLIWSFIICCILQIGLVSVQPLAELFSMAVLGFEHWKYIWILSIIPIIAMEIAKLFDMYSKK